MTGTFLLVLALTAQDTLTLARAHTAAAARDPRLVQSALAAVATNARIAAMETERKPQFALRAEATHQSDVTGLPVALPGVTAARPPKDRFQATLSVEQLLYDAGSRAARERVERARLTEAQAGQEAARYTLLSEVDRSFFAAWSLQERAEQFTTLAADLEGRLAAARARVREGTGLPRDTAAVAAERLGALQRRNDALSERAAALDVLAQLTGIAPDPAPRLVLPDLEDRTRGMTAAQLRDALRQRPEFAFLEQSAHRIDMERELTTAVNRPRVVAFGQGGVGRPGLNQFERDPAGFWQAGIRLEWRPFTWHSAALGADALTAQRKALDADAAALGEQLTRAATGDLARIARLRESLATSAQITALRTIVDATARLQFDEGVLTASEYLTTRTALLDAQLAEQRDRSELARLQATLLTTLGLPLR